MDRVDTLTQDCFNAIIALKHLDHTTPPKPEDLQREIRRQIDRLLQRAPKLGLQAQQAHEMAYALVALIDEVALAGPPDVSHYWMGRMLQTAYFQENRAGEGFFDHLERARRDQDHDVLRVYYLCLLLDFRGRYNVQSGERDLADVISSLRYELSRAGWNDPEALSPDAERPLEPISAADHGARWFWLPVGGLALALVLYAILATLIGGRASDAAAFIGGLVR